jgi:predicted metalloprotease with PDZ domain
MTPGEYLENMVAEIARYEHTPGRKVMSAESASFNAWIKGYRPDENTPNSAIDYYNKGDLLGWMLDFEIRSRTGGKKTLDDVMRYLEQNYAERGVGFPENDLKSVFEKVAGGDLTDFFNRYVSGTDEINFDRYLRMAGLQIHPCSTRRKVASKRRADTSVFARGQPATAFLSATFLRARPPTKAG